MTAYLFAKLLSFVGFNSSFTGFSAYFWGAESLVEGWYDFGSSFFMISRSKGLYALFELFSTFEGILYGITSVSLVGT